MCLERLVSIEQRRSLTKAGVCMLTRILGSTCGPESWLAGFVSSSLRSPDWPLCDGLLVKLMGVAAG